MIITVIWVWSWFSFESLYWLRPLAGGPHRFDAWRIDSDPGRLSFSRWTYYNGRDAMDTPGQWGDRHLWGFHRLHGWHAFSIVGPAPKFPIGFWRRLGFDYGSYQPRM